MEMPKVEGLIATGEWVTYAQIGLIIDTLGEDEIFEWYNCEHETIEGVSMWKVGRAYASRIAQTAKVRATTYNRQLALSVQGGEADAVVSALLAQGGQLLYLDILGRSWISVDRKCLVPLVRLLEEQGVEIEPFVKELIEAVFATSRSIDELERDIKGFYGLARHLDGENIAETDLGFFSWPLGKKRAFKPPFEGLEGRWASMLFPAVCIAMWRLEMWGELDQMDWSSYYRRTRGSREALQRGLDAALETSSWITEEQAAALRDLLQEHDADPDLYWRRALAGELQRMYSKVEGLERLGGSDNYGEPHLAPYETIFPQIGQYREWREQHGVLVDLPPQLAGDVLVRAVHACYQFVRLAERNHALQRIEHDFAKTAAIETDALEQHWQKLRQLGERWPEVGEYLSWFEAQLKRGRNAQCDPLPAKWSGGSLGLGGLHAQLTYLYFD